jgi:hypothetical protein
VEGTLMPGANAALRTASGTLGDSSSQRAIAEATGGRAFTNLNDISPAIRTILDESGLVYALRFVPGSPDDRMHNLDVDLVKAKSSGVDLQFRKRYLAAKEPPQLSMAQLAAEPLTISGIGLAAVAQPGEQPGTLKVDLSVMPGDLTWIKSGDRWNASFELGLFIEGAPITAGTVKSFNLGLTDDQRTQLMTNGMLINGTIPVNSPQAVIRAVVREKNSGNFGSVHVIAGEGN